MSQKIKNVLVFPQAMAAIEPAIAQLRQHHDTALELHTFAPGAEWQTAVQERPWQLVVVDFDETEPAATAVVRHIRSVQPHTPIFVTAAIPSVPDAVAMMRLGAHGFAAKDDLPQLVQQLSELLTAIQPSGTQGNVPPNSKQRHPSKHPPPETTENKTALLESEQRLRSIMENMEDLVWVMELPSHQITYLNPAVKTIYGFSASDFYEDSSLWAKHLHPEEVANVLELETTVFEQGFRDAEYRIRRANGEVRWLRDRAWLVRDEHGEPIRIEGLASDITEQKLAKQALQASEEQYRSLIESSEAAISMVDGNGRYLYLNSICALPFDAPPEALIGKTVQDLFPPNEAADILADVKKVIHEGIGLVLEPEVTLNGQSCWFHTSIQPIRDINGQPMAALIYASEITAKKQTERELLVQNAIIHQTRDLIALGDFQGKVVFINQGGAKLLGGSDPNSIIGDPVASFHLPEDAQKIVTNYLPHALEHGVWHGENRILTKDGRLINVAQTIFPIRDDKNEIIYQATLMTDITERKQVEETLKSQASLLNQVSDAIIATDLNLKINSWNKAAEKIYGWSEAEAVGQTVDKLLHTSWPQVSQAAAKQIIRETGLWHGELKQVTKDGTPKTIWASVSLIKNAQGDIVGGVTVNRDMTQEKQMEDALRTSEQQFQQFMRYLPGAVFIKDASGRTIYCNELYAQTSGKTPADVIGKRTLEYLPAALAEPFIQENEQVLALNQAQEFNHSFPGEGGMHYWLTTKFPIPQENKPPLLGAMSLDVTKEKRAEAALQEAHNLLEQRVIERTTELESAKQRIEAIFNHSGDGILLLNKIEGIQQTNHAFDQMFGLPTNSQLGTQMAQLFHPDDAAMLNQIIDEIARSHHTSQVTARARRATGDYFDVEISIAPVNRSNKEVVNLVCIVRDITDRKAAEEALRLSEQRYRLLAENIKDVIVKLSPEGNLTFVTPSSYYLTGHHPEELMGRPVLSLAHPEDIPGVIQLLQDAHREQRPFFTFTQRLQHKEGHYVWVEVTNTVIRNDDGSIKEFVGILRDITERKKAEAAILQTQVEERELQSYLKLLHTISIRLTRAETLDDFFRAAVAEAHAHFGFERVVLLLYDAEEQCATGTYGINMQGQLVDEHDFYLTAAEMRGVMRQTLDRSERFAFAENTPLYDGKTVIGTGQNAVATLWNNRALGWLAIDNAIHGRPLTRAQLEVLALYALTVGALLARKRAELALRDSEARYQSVVQTQSELICRYLPDLTLTFVNNAYCRYFDTTPEQLIGHNFLELIPEAEWAGIRASYAELVRTKGTSTYEHKVLAPDGSHRWQLWTDTAVVDENGDVVAIQGVGLDITERKQMEEALRQALAQEKELGELKSRFVSMASHEFRTPLAAILATTETLSIYRNRMDDHQIEVRLEKIRNQVRHMKEVMEDVLHLARIQAGRMQINPETADLDALCQDIVEEFSSQADYHNRVVYTSNCAPLTAVFDIHLMRQVISNLISNALKYSAREKLVQVTLTQAAGHIVFSVQDEGIGIPTQDMKFLFEPFHRATNVGTISGTGLGLSITRRAVELHGGTIVPVSQVDLGTTITVFLPQPAAVEPQANQKERSKT